MLALARDLKTWKLAQILEVRYEVPVDPEVELIIYPPGTSAAEAGRVAGEE